MSIFAIWIRRKNIRRKLRSSLYRMDSIRFPIMESGKATWYIQHPGKKTRNAALDILNLFL
jgi:hypothetical protein